MDSQTKARIAITSVFATVGVLIVGPLILPAHVVMPALTMIGAACFVVVYTLKTVQWFYDRKADKTAGGAIEPRSNVQVLPISSSGQDGENR